MSTQTIRTGLCACCLIAISAWPVAVNADSDHALFIRPTAKYSTPAFPHTADTTVVPEVLVLLRNDDEHPISLLSRDGRSPHFMMQCLLGSRRKVADRMDGPLEEALTKRVALPQGDSLYLAVPVLFETVALRLRLFIETDSGEGYEDFLSDLVEVGDLPTSRLVNREAAVRAVLERFPDAELLPTPPALQVSPRHGKIWDVRVRSNGERRVIVVGALSGEVLSELEKPGDGH